MRGSLIFNQGLFSTHPNPFYALPQNSLFGSLKIHRDIPSYGLNRYVESIQSISGSRQTGSHSDKPARNGDFCGIAILPRGFQLRAFIFHHSFRRPAPDLDAAERFHVTHFIKSRQVRHSPFITATRLTACWPFSPKLKRWLLSAPILPLTRTMLSASGKLSVVETVER
jgi:hypothetical protein